jgi:hypothetical protein
MAAARTTIGCALVALLAACEPTIGDAPGIGVDNRPDPVDAGEDVVVIDAQPLPDLPDAGSEDVLLVQTTSEQILAQNSIACVEQDADGNAVQNRQNSYYRVFELADFGVTGGLDVNSVRFGVESAVSPETVQPATVIVYTLAGGELLLANLTEIGRAAVSVSDQTQGVIDVPVTATAPAGATLVAEVLIPDSNTGNRMFIGSNTLGESAPSFLRAPAAGCDLIEPTPMAEVSPEPVHLVLSISGTRL